MIFGFAAVAVPDRGGRGQNLWKKYLIAGCRSEEGRSTNLRQSVMVLSPGEVLIVRLKATALVLALAGMGWDTATSAAVFDVSEFGASGDGETLDMAAIQAAIDADNMTLQILEPCVSS